MGNKQFVIVGGSQGIGLELVKRLSAGGGDVLVLSRTAEQLQGMPRVEHLTWDATKDELAAEQLPPMIHGLAYCPGSINLRPFQSLGLDAYRQDFELNVLGAVKAIRASLPALKAAEDAAVLLFSTVAVQQGMPAHASIAASKGAIEGLTRTLANEFAPGVRVNCIAPALTETNLTTRFFRDETRAKALGEKYPLKRTGTVADIASMGMLLLTDASGWVTGQVIGVDGGMSTAGH